MAVRRFPGSRSEKTSCRFLYKSSFASAISVILSSLYTRGADETTLWSSTNETSNALSSACCVRANSGIGSSHEGKARPGGGRFPPGRGRGKRAGGQPRSHGRGRGERLVRHLTRRRFRRDGETRRR